MQYRKKPAIVEAILFAYTPAGIAALMEFTGDDLAGINKSRTPNAVAVANVAGRALYEGNYLVKEGHDYRVMTKLDFESMYEAVPNAAAPAPVVEAKEEAKPAVVAQPAPAKAEPVRHYTIAAAQRAARKRGDTTFQFHRPCHYGHKGLRYTANGNCVKCQSNHSKRSYKRSQLKRSNSQGAQA